MDLPLRSSPGLPPLSRPPLTTHHPHLPPPTSPHPNPNPCALQSTVSDLVNEVANTKDQALSLTDSLSGLQVGGAARRRR